MSDKVDHWVKKEPRSWSKLATTNKKKLTLQQFKKALAKGAKTKGKYNAIKAMTNQQINKIYKASQYYTPPKTTGKPIKPKEKAYKQKKIRIKRNGKTYTKTINGQWKPYTQFALKIASKTKPRTKQYNEQVKNIMKTTGRTRQAVTKKIQRTRKQK